MRRPVSCLVVASVLVLGLAGCGKTAIRRDARITGTVHLCGGPVAGRCFMPPVRISVLGPDQHLIATQAAADLRFSFSLLPGTYTLVAKADGDVIEAVVVNAVAGDTRRTDIDAATVRRAYSRRSSSSQPTVALPLPATTSRPDRWRVTCCCLCRGE